MGIVFEYGFGLTAYLVFGVPFLGIRVLVDLIVVLTVSVIFYRKRLALTPLILINLIPFMILPLGFPFIQLFIAASPVNIIVLFLSLIFFYAAKSARQKKDNTTRTGAFI